VLPYLGLAQQILTVQTVNRTLGTHYTLDQVWELDSELIETCLAVDRAQHEAQAGRK
jgi:hypothetical protein